MSSKLKRPIFFFAIPSEMKFSYKNQVMTDALKWCSTVLEVTLITVDLYSHSFLGHML